jgi:hypothetical protein
MQRLMSCSEHPSVASGISQPVKQHELSPATPIKISRSPSRYNRLSKASNSDVEEFLSSCSPFELPFIPPHVRHLPNLEVRSGEGVTSVPRHAERLLVQDWRSRQKGWLPADKSLVSTMFDEQSPEELLACKRQLKRKERILNNSHTSSEQRPVTRARSAPVYNVDNETSW